VSDTPRMKAAQMAAMEHITGDVYHVGCDIERELNAANERIRLLIAERDTARRQADQQYNLREEFLDLLGTVDVEQGVAVVRGLQERIKRLEDSVSYWNERYNDLNYKVQNRDNY